MHEINLMIDLTLHIAQMSLVGYRKELNESIEYIFNSK
jgi:hypothetical protein